jgi:glycerophosphoryl diester phosphodiesterase
LVLDSERVLVANDNNYPFSLGRPPAIDNNEIAILQFDAPLNLDPRLGLSAAMGLAPNTVVGTSGVDDVVPGPLYSPGSFDGRGDLLFTGAGVDMVDAELGSGYDNRIFTGSGADVIYAGSSDVITGGSGDDVISALGGGDNRLSGMGGNDEFIIGTSFNRALGGAGNDKFTILETAGTNYLNGGAGVDQFWLVSEPGERPAAKQVVMDFSPGEDKVGLRGLSFSALSFSQVGADTVLSGSGAAIGHFNNLSASTLNNQAHFLFS